MTQQTFTVDHGLTVNGTATTIELGEIGPSSSPGLSSTSSVALVADSLGSSVALSLTTTGNLLLPQDGTIYETNIPFGGLAGKTIALKPYGGTSDDQQLLVYPTAGADANHLHLTSGNLYNTELFLGNDDLYVKLGNTGNVVINSNDGTGNTAQWTFGTAGTILNSGNLTLQTPNGVPGAVIAITNTSGSWESNPSANLATTGGTGTGLTVNVSNEGGYASSISIATAGTGYTDGDTIDVTSGSSSATFTISVVKNQWTVDTAGNLTVAGSILMPPNSALIGSLASPSPSIFGFTNISGQELTTVSGIINSGTTTVVDDGINSIALAPGATMDVFGFPFSAAGIRGQLTISGITSTTQANGTWYYESTSDIAYKLYTDSTYSTLVDATGWTAYTGGGSVAITKHADASNVVIDSNGYFSKFDNTGNVTLPGDLSVVGGVINLTGEGVIRSNYDTVSIQSYDVANAIAYGLRVGDNGGVYLEQGTTPSWLYFEPNAGNAQITSGLGTSGGAGKNLTITAGAADQTDYYTTSGGNVNITGGLGAQNDGGGGGPGGSVNLTAGASSDSAGHYGNITINTGGANTWTFDYTGNLTAPGNITGNTAGYAIGYRDIPQVSLAANATTALSDAGKHYYSTSASNLSLTIANNTSVGWAVGTAISIVNRGTGNITVAGGSGVSLYLAGNSTAGNRTVTTYGMATVMNVAANVWMISGTVV